MGKPCVVLSVAWLLVGCGSGAGYLDGKVNKHEIAVKESIFIPLPDGEVFVAAADQENLCAIMNGQQRPGKETTFLEVWLVNMSSSAFEPLVTGPYTISRYVSIPGKWSYAIFGWTSECITFAALGPNSGTINVESVGLQQPGGQTAVAVDLTFGDSHLTGHLNATYCALASQAGTACQPPLRALPPAME